MTGIQSQPHTASLLGSSDEWGDGCLTVGGIARGVRLCVQLHQVGTTSLYAFHHLRISIDEDAATIEGCTLNITVRDLRDANGNYSVPAIWTAYVNQKQLVWKEDEMNLTIAHDTGATITATLVNKGGQQQLWTLSNVPQWLKASTENGQTNPLEETTVTFTIDKSTPIGNYETTIYLTGNDDIATPTINAKLSSL